MKRLISIATTIINEFKKATFATFLTSIKQTIKIPSSETQYYLKNGTKLSYEPNTLDVMVIRECFINNAYTKFIKDHALQTVLDFGAHKGYFILGLLHAGIRVSTIVGVEPLKENIRVLQKNIDANKHLMQSVKNVFIEPYAVSSKIGKAAFFITDNSVSHSFFDPSASAKVIRKTFVPLITPEKLSKKYHLDKIDLIKFDIEGAEYAIFDSDQAKYILKAKYIVMELHPYYLKDISTKKTDPIIRTLRQHGYTIKIPNKAWPDLIFAEKSES